MGIKTNEEYKQEWLNELRFAAKLEPKTVRMYEIRLNQFIESLNGKSLVDVKRPDIINFLANEKDSKNSTSFKQSVVRNFYAWMSDNDYVEKHPMLKPIRLGNEESLPKFLEKEQWETIKNYLQEECRKYFKVFNTRNDLVEIIRANNALEAKMKYVKKNKMLSMFYVRAIETDDFVSERNFIMVYFMVHSGLRSFETLDLTVDKINFNQQEVRVIGKRNKERIVQLNTLTTKMLKNYIEKYNLTGYVFPTKTGTKLSKSAMNKLFEKITKHTGIEINPHMTRHTYGQMEYDRGTPLEMIQKQMGHTSIDITEIYAKVRNQQVKQMINRN